MLVVIAALVFSANADVELLQSLFEDAKRGSLATVNQSWPLDAKPRLSDNRAEQARQFWLENRKFVPAQNAIHSQMIGKEAVIFLGSNNAEVWDFNGDEKRDFFLAYFDEQTNCSKFAVLASNVEGYSYFDSGDLAGYQHGDKSFCGDRSNSMRPYGGPFNSNGKITWVFSYTDRDIVVLKEFDFSEPKESVLVGELRYRYLGPENVELLDVETDHE